MRTTSPNFATMAAAIVCSMSYNNVERSDGVDKLRASKLRAAANTLENGIEETLTYTSFPHEHWIKIRSNNGIERINREIRRRTNVVGTFPVGNSALMLVCARLRYVSSSDWGTKKYLNMEHLYELEREAVRETGTQDI